MGDVLDGLGNFFGAGLFEPGTAPGLPSASKTSKQYLNLINAFGQGDPALLSTEEQNQPGFENLALSGLDQALNGGDGTEGFLGQLTGNVIPALTGATNTANTATRAATVGDLGALGPGASSAIDASNPGQAALLKSLTNTATNQLKLGTQLDPNSVSQINSAVNANWANRGLGTSSPAMLDDALQLNAGGQNLLAQRESQAGTVANQNMNAYEDPILSMLGITSTAPGQAEGAVSAGDSIATGSTPQFNSADALNTGYNAVATQNIDAANVANQGTGLEQMAKSY